MRQLEAMMKRLNAATPICGFALIWAHPGLKRQAPIPLYSSVVLQRQAPIQLYSSVVLQRRAPTPLYSTAILRQRQDGLVC